MSNDNQGGFLIDIPGLTTDQITEALNATCTECGASCGTHFPECLLETREPIKIDMTPRTVEEVCRERGIPYDPKEIDISRKSGMSNMTWREEGETIR